MNGLDPAMDGKARSSWLQLGPAVGVWLTYLNLLPRWASYRRFRGPWNPRKGVRPTHHVEIGLPIK